jgi:ribosomal protein S18 acetylase RimI-like enzyme
MAVDVRRLEPGDEEIVRALTDRQRYEPLTAASARRFLTEPHNLMVVAFDGGAPVGFVLGYELQRRHGPERSVFVYDVDVEERYRRRGIGTKLIGHLFELGRQNGATDAFVLTDQSNETAMAFYRALGGRRERDDDVLFDFRL